jgi:hypothetical protein
MLKVPDPVAVAVECGDALTVGPQHQKETRHLFLSKTPPFGPQPIIITVDQW